MCLKCWGMLNVLSVYVCVELNCELGGQFVSWAVYVLSDSPPPPGPSRCWIKILAGHCWHCMHTRNGLINSARVKGKKGVKKAGKGLWTHWQSALTLRLLQTTQRAPYLRFSLGLLHIEVTYSIFSKVTPLESTDSQNDWRLNNLSGQGIMLKIPDLYILFESI